MTLPVLAKSTLFLLLRFFSSILVPGLYLRKSISTSYRSATPCRQEETACTLGVMPASVATTWTGSPLPRVNRNDREMPAASTRNR